jgi:hypothetical protein
MFTPDGRTTNDQRKCANEESHLEAAAANETIARAVDAPL